LKPNKIKFALQGKSDTVFPGKNKKTEYILHEEVVTTFILVNTCYPGTGPVMPRAARRDVIGGFYGMFEGGI
jgi:hypothetical protein